MVYRMQCRACNDGEIILFKEAVNISPTVVGWRQSRNNKESGEGEPGGIDFYTALSHPVISPQTQAMICF